MIASAFLAFSGAGRDACAFSALSFEQVTVIDSASGFPITESEPATKITIRATGTFDRLSIVILFGTVTGTNWSQKLIPRFRIGFSGKYTAEWNCTVPYNATGTARIDITGYSPLLTELTLRTAFLNVTPFTAAYVGSDACSKCHGMQYAAWQGSAHYPYTGCESCHGPGGDHVGAVRGERAQLGVERRFGAGRQPRQRTKDDVAPLRG